MNFKKRVNGSWTDAPYYIHKTDTDTITTLPAVIHPTGTTATVGLKGQTLQSSVPSPTSPSMPNGTGDRTGNLWDNRGFSAVTIPSDHTHNISNAYGTTLSTTTGNEVTITQSEYPTGNTGYQNGFFMIDVDFSKYAVGDVVTISFDYIVNEIHALSTQFQTTVYAGNDSNMISNALTSGDWKISGKLIAKITIIADMRPYVEVRLCGNSITVKNIMLNEGSTVLRYEPYGIKIPISSANTTTPVYLGEVQSTRNIRKLVLTGNEKITSVAVTGGLAFLCNPTPYTPNQWKTADNLLSSHYKSEYSNDDGRVYFTTTRLVITDFACSTIDEFKAYLTEQYAAGTPVTVWYVLATPKTAVVNEPLMRIGDYADTLSNVSIPVTAGANTISVDTTVQPSEVTVNYKGWHPVADVHERESGQWT